jgi:hypothetical protein
MTTTCYWCGSPSTSREHVPPKNLFPQGKNKNLITVPSCTAHNEDLSDFDEAFRFFLQAVGSSPDAIKEFSTTTFRGLSRPQKEKFVQQLAEESQRVEIGDQTTIVLRIDPAKQGRFFEKIIRGLYFHLFGKPASGRVVSVSRQFIVPGFDYDELDQLLGPHLADPKTTSDGKTDNPDIFRFKYARVFDAGREATAILMTFYEGVEVLGLITEERSRLPQFD